MLHDLHVWSHPGRSLHGRLRHVFRLPCRETLNTLSAIVGTAVSSSSSIDKRSKYADTVRTPPVVADERHFPFLCPRFFYTVIDGLGPSSLCLNNRFTHCKHCWPFFSIFRFSFFLFSVFLLFPSSTFSSFFFVFEIFSSIHGDCHKGSLLSLLCLFLSVSFLWCSTLWSSFCVRFEIVTKFHSNSWASLWTRFLRVASECSFRFCAVYSFSSRDCHQEDLVQALVLNFKLLLVSPQS